MFPNKFEKHQTVKFSEKPAIVEVYNFALFSFFNPRYLVSMPVKLLIRYPISKKKITYVKFSALFTKNKIFDFEIKNHAKHLKLSKKKWLNPFLKVTFDRGKILFYEVFF